MSAESARDAEKNAQRDQQIAAFTAAVLGGIGSIAGAESLVLSIAEDLTPRVEVAGHLLDAVASVQLLGQPRDPLAEGGGGHGDPV